MTKKAYGHITRMNQGEKQLLVFRHSVEEAGIQIPKGTIKSGETPYEAVIREMAEETGLVEFLSVKKVAEDCWKADDGTRHERFFYEMQINTAEDEWTISPTGGGEEEGITFSYFWIFSDDEVELARGHGDYIYRVLSK
ncbi:NUDIX hydrolase [Shouchella patagoniensis]|uniref:NUDIX hydrolase n=1 Tax=Shouchella patagoniensis TaxID=228576 RepID=UPI0009953186|nr:NUDIX domain-containing protein [Shouchella patagoniensis]